MPADREVFNPSVFHHWRGLDRAECERPVLLPQPTQFLRRFQLKAELSFHARISCRRRDRSLTFQPGARGAIRQLCSIAQPGRIDIMRRDFTRIRNPQIDHYRLAIMVDLRIADSGEVTAHDVYAAWLRNRAKLAYSSTGAWLEGQGPIPAAATNPGMEAQLRLQLETAQKLRGLRKQHGALTFGSIEASPVMENGRVKDLAIRRHNVAEDIIESFMVAANVAMAQYLKEKGSPSIRRVVRTPKRWDRIQAITAGFGVRLPSAPDPRALAEFLEQRKMADPVHFPDLSLSIVKLLGPGEYIVEPPGAEQEGHFGLAVHDYTHSTAPNRRYADLVTQRLLKATSASQQSPYSEVELSAIASHCTEREDAARKVERLMRKVVAASLLSRRVGEVFDGIITG